MTLYNSLTDIIFLATHHSFRFVPAAGVDWSGNWDHGKQPLISIHDASNDVTLLNSWAAKYNHCNWLYVPGDGQAVLDVDPRHGGDELLSRLQTEHGALPRTVRSKTGGGGWHYYLTAPQGLRLKHDLAGCKGLTLATGSMMGVVVPPCKHKSGGVYAWELAPWDGPMDPISDWLLAMVSGPADRKKSSMVGEAKSLANLLKPVGSGLRLAEHPGADDGTRNKTLASLVGAELARGRDPDEVWEEATEFGERCVPPLTQSEIDNPFKSLRKKEEAKAEGQQHQTHNTPPNSQAQGEVISLVKEGSEGSSFGNAESQLSTPLKEGNFFGLPNGPIPSEDVGKDTSLTHLGGGESAAELSSLTHISAEVFEPSESGDKLTSLTHDEFLRHGIIRELAVALEPELEGRIEPVVFCLLSAVGNAIGPAAGLMTQGDAQPGRIWAVCVAPSGAGKSEPFGATNMLMKMAAPEWSDRCVCHGLGSGPGLVERVRDVCFPAV
ncbi:MAG: bifunctional DNA primase/polymerase [Planctomycetes bacterium]|nr:bifunctional DNA primase/polymerase [Planctomycetota bacterium]